MNHGHILRATLSVGFYTGLSRILGLVREVLMARYFGTSMAKSAFDVAFRIPNLFRALFGEGALCASFIPVYADVMQKQGREKADALAGKIMTMMLVVLVGLTTLGILVIVGIWTFFPLGPRTAAVLPLLAIMLPYMIFMCLVAVCMGILNSLRHFKIPAFTPCLLNLLWILVLIFICPMFGESALERIHGVAWGVVAAGAIQLAIQLPVLRKFGFRPRPSMDWRDPHLVDILKLMGPSTLGMGVHQVNVCMDGILAFWAATWAPAALTYAERLIYLPLGVFATSLGTVLLPTFSHHAARDEHDQMCRTLESSIPNLMAVLVPCALGILALALPITRLTYLWSDGMFDDVSAVRTARALAFYAPGLVAFGLHKTLVPAFYAMKDTSTPVRVAVQMVGLNFVLNVLFVITWPVEFKHAGLAFATVITSFLSCYLLARLLRERIGAIGWRQIGRKTVRIVVAALLMAGAAAWVESAVRLGLASAGWGGKLSESIGLLAGVLTGVGVYIGIAFVLCGEQVKALREVLARRPARQAKGGCDDPQGF
jgi:putative peptidoglycan lipid II flippase